MQWSNQSVISLLYQELWPKKPEKHKNTTVMLWRHFPDNILPSMLGYASVSYTPEGNLERIWKWGQWVWCTWPGEHKPCSRCRTFSSRPSAAPGEMALVFLSHKTTSTEGTQTASQNELLVAFWRYLGPFSTLSLLQDAQAGDLRSEAGLWVLCLIFFFLKKRGAK